MACGCGLIGSLVISPGSVSPVYSKPVSRGGESALFSFEVLEIDSTVGFDVKIQTKKRSSTTWLDLAAFASPITTTGVHSLDMSGFEDDARVVMASHAGSSSGNWTRVDSMNFAWRPY